MYERWIDGILKTKNELKLIQTLLSLSNRIRIMLQVLNAILSKTLLKGPIQGSFLLEAAIDI